MPPNESPASVLTSFLCYAWRSSIQSILLRLQDQTRSQIKMVWLQAIKINSTVGSERSSEFSFVAAYTGERFYELRGDLLFCHYGYLLSSVWVLGSEQNIQSALNSLEVLLDIKIQRRHSVAEFWKYNALWTSWWPLCKFMNHNRPYTNQKCQHWPSSAPFTFNVSES